MTPHAVPLQGQVFLSNAAPGATFLGQGHTVVLQEDHFEPVAHNWIMVDDIADGRDQLDDHLSHVVTRGCLERGGKVKHEHSCAWGTAGSSEGPAQLPVTRGWCWTHRGHTQLRGPIRVGESWLSIPQRDQGCGSPASPHAIWQTNSETKAPAPPPPAVTPHTPSLVSNRAGLLTATSPGCRSVSLKVVF